MLMHNTPAINSTCFFLTYPNSMSENSLLAYLINCPCACPHFINFRQRMKPLRRIKQQIGKIINFLDLIGTLYLVNLFLQRTFFIIITAKNTVISPDFLVWKFCRKSQFLHSFGQFAHHIFHNFYTRKSGEITVFFAVYQIKKSKIKLF